MVRDKSLRQPIRLKVRDYRARKRKLTLNGFLIKDPAFAEVVRSIEIVGNRRTDLALMGLSGDLVEFEVVPAKDSPSKEFGLGRLNTEGWTNFSEIEQPNLQHVATIDVSKHSIVRKMDRGEDINLTSYVYANDISGWPSAGMFGLSYDGTIKRSKFRRGLDQLISCKDFKATADYYYFFEKEAEHLVRKRLCSITIEPKRAEANIDRAVAAVRTALSFVFEVNLKPLRKIQIDSENYKIVDIPQPEIDRSDREFYARPIHMQDQKNFTSSMIRWLYNSNVDVAHVEYAVSRYVAASRVLPLEISFSAGCEALESLFATVGTRAIPKGPEETGAIDHLRAELKRLDMSASKKKLAHAKMGGLFLEPTWAQIKSYILGKSKFLTKYEIDALEQCNFFRYRNLSSHGRKIAADGEVSRQNILMRMSFQSLLKVIVGCRAHLNLQTIFDLSPPDPSDGPHFVEIWE